MLDNMLERWEQMLPELGEIVDHVFPAQTTTEYFWQLQPKDADTVTAVLYQRTDVRSGDPWSSMLRSGTRVVEQQDFEVGDDTLEQIEQWAQKAAKPTPAAEFVQKHSGRHKV